MATGRNAASLLGLSTSFPSNLLKVLYLNFFWARLFFCLVRSALNSASVFSWCWGASSPLPCSPLPLLLAES